MLAIEQMGNEVQFIFYAIGLVAFVLAAIGVNLGTKVANLVALGLAAVTVPEFWARLALL